MESVKPEVLMVLCEVDNAGVQIGLDLCDHFFFFNGTNASKICKFHIKISLSSFF